MNSWDEDMVRQNLCFATRSITYNMLDKKMLALRKSSTWYHVQYICSLYDDAKLEKEQIFSSTPSSPLVD